ncbi:MAG: response regulator, partial [Candidatus Competibacteraceae bacterium]
DRQHFVAPIYLEPLALPSATPLEKRYLGAVELELATAPVQIEQAQRFLRNIGLVSIALLAGLGLAGWTGFRLARSIHQTARAIERIKGGELTVRLPRTEVNEIGILQDGVNLLAETIAGEQARLENELAKVRGEYERVLARLRVQTQNAEQASQAKSLFLAKVSHEMRTPLYSIQGLAEQLLHTAPNSDEERTIQTLLGAARTLYDTISDILDFTQLERGKYTPHFEPLDLWAEIEQVVETVAPLAIRQRLYLDVIVEPRRPASVWGDSRAFRAFRAIAANLIANAVKFTETGGVSIRLSAPASPAAGPAPIRLQVRDTGCGIPADQISAIFAPFEQVDGALNRRYGGIGLGLSIVKGYCDVLNGHVDVASRLGEGTTFTVTLSFDRTDLESRAVRFPLGMLANVRLEEKTIPHHRRRRHFLAGKTVLVVEDFEINREIVTRQLRQHGLRVLEASEGDEATRIAVCSDLHLILMDIQMPGTDGIAAIQAIRTLPAGAGLPILAFTASADRPTHDRAMAAGAHGVLVKPLSEEELINAVYETLMGLDAPVVATPAG